MDELQLLVTKVQSTKCRVQSIGGRAAAARDQSVAPRRPRRGGALARRAGKIRSTNAKYKVVRLRDEQAVIARNAVHGLLA